MNFLKLHNTDGAEVSVNLALVQVIEPCEYGKAKVSKLFFAQSVYDVLETPEEIFGMNIGRIKGIPESVVYVRKNLLQAERGPHPETWYPDLRR